MPMTTIKATRVHRAYIRQAYRSTTQLLHLLYTREIEMKRKADHRRESKQRTLASEFSWKPHLLTMFHRETLPQEYGRFQENRILESEGGTEREREREGGMVA